MVMTQSYNWRNVSSHLLYCGFLLTAIILFERSMECDALPTLINVQHMF